MDLIDYIHPDIEVLARTIYGEARGERFEGKVAVGLVVVNRLLAKSWYGSSIFEVCTKPWQFSCWNRNDPNRDKILSVDRDSDVFVDCLRAASFALSGLEYDTTEGATHYMTKARYRQGWPRSWGEKKEPHVTVGNHLFFKDID